MVQSYEKSEHLFREYIGIWNQRTYADIPTVVSESFVMYDPFAPAKGIPGPGGEVHGRSGLETFIRGTVTGFPDFHVAIIDLLVNENMAMYEGRLTMTHTGEFFGIPPSNGRVAVRYMGLVRIAEGMITEHRVYPPLRKILHQLGLNFPGIFALVPTLAWGKLRQLTG